MLGRERPKGISTVASCNCRYSYRHMPALEKRISGRQDCIEGHYYNRGIWWGYGDVQVHVPSVEA